MNLLHFVALEAQKKDTKLLEFPLKLKHVLPAARISLETLDTDLQCQTSRTRSVEEKVQRDTELLRQLDSFLQSAALTLSALRVSRQQLKQEGSELIDFFCEDRDTFRLDDCFSIFNIFCFKFTHAVKENMEREVKETARRRRIQELEEQKRHSAGSEEVGGAFGLRHSSETNMSSAASRHNDAALLAELLSPKSRMRRSRNSPFSSELIAADRELSMFLGMAKPDAKEAKTAFLSASPERRSPGFSETVPTCSFPQNKQPQAGQMSPQTSSSPPKTYLSEQKANRTTTTYLSDDATQNRANAFNPTSKVTVNATSDSNQQSDHNNNDGEGRLGTLSGNLSGSKGRTNQANQDLSERIGHTASTTTGAMSVVLEKHTLVPELKAFDEVATVTGRNAIHRRGFHRDDVVIADLEEEQADMKVQKNTEKSERRSSSSEEDEGTEENVVVWCVTGVCDAAGEHTHADDTHAQTEQDQRRSDNQAGNQQASSAPANRTPSDPQPANEKPASVPISSQPVPVPRCDDPSRPASSPMWRPAEPSSANDAPALTANQREEADDRSRNETAPCLTTNENTEAVSCTNEKEESSSKTSNHTSKTRNAGMKLAADANKCKSVRTLTNSEYQDMRRVVPISRPSRGAPFLGRRPEKPPGLQRGLLQRAAAAAVSNPSASVRRAERPSTAPSSRRSSFTKDSPDPKVSAREQNQQDLQRKPSVRKPSVRKPSVKPRPPPEEKMCRSTLRALSQSGGRTASAIPIPLHKANSSSSLQGFARSTASSFFRQTHTTLPPRPLSPHPGSDSSSKSSSPRVTSSPLSRTASLRVPAASRSADLLNLSSSSSSLTGTQSVRASPRRVPPVPPKGHGRDGGAVFSDKSARPSWR
uniref:FH2 domain-containing protein n=1 Tax=Sander lucioperca TaxID=283035 RepID=A0A8C9ZQA0_SANLU